MNTNLKNNKNILKYLNGNNKQLGISIIPITKNQKNIENKLGYTILLYYDHKYAKISRYLVNYNLYNYMEDFKNELSEQHLNSNEFNDNIIRSMMRLNASGYKDYYKKLEYIYKIVKNPKIYTFENDSYFDPIMINTNKDNLTIKNDINLYNRFSLTDGLLNRKMFTYFLFEILNTYKTNYKKYLNPDLNLIKLIERYHNKDNNFTDAFDMTFIDKDSMMLAIEDIQKYGKVQEIEYTNQYYQINPDEGAMDIYIPTVFITYYNAKFLEEVLLRLNLKLVKKNIKDMPQCIKDLKAQINDKTIQDINGLSEMIIKYNSQIDNKLYKIANKIK